MTDILAIVTALCSVVLGPLVSLWSTQEQAAVAVRSAYRQAWINTVQAEAYRVVDQIRIAGARLRRDTGYRAIAHGL